jgi:AcrR family transcriptional regulator
MSSSKPIEPETRIRILEAARRLMEEKHGRGVRMRDVAEVAGTSRQAVYDHFGSRANLILETTHYLDAVLNLDERRQPMLDAQTGIEKLDAYINFWGNYIPEVYGLAQALMADRHSDPAAEAAWQDRMAAVYASCSLIVETLEQDGALAEEWSIDSAADMLWTLLSIRNWEHLTIDRRWTQSQYIDYIRVVTQRALLVQKSA